jgi:septum site-determining protein MinD
MVVKVRRIIGIVSGKGGVGKTVTTINLGIALSRLGKNVTIVDADLTASNLGLQLGLYSFPNTLQDVLTGKVRIKKALYDHMGMKLVPASISIGSIDSNARRLKNTVKNLDEITLIDSPPGLGSDALATIDACNEVLVITTPEIQTMANAVKAIHIAREKKKDVLGIVINRCKNDRYELSEDEMLAMAETSILGKIPEEPAVKKSLFEKVPLIAYAPYCKASIEFNRLAAQLLNMDYEPPKFAFFNRLVYRLKGLR